MLPFFRKIRYRLAENNQFFKYSRYAIGEIVLVVVGILIALYINNWNEERKNNLKKSHYIQKLSSDLKKDTIAINGLINWVAQETITVKEINSLFDKPDTVFTIDSIIKITTRVNYLNTGTSAFNDETFQSLVSTGELGLLDEAHMEQLITLNKMQAEHIRMTKINSGMILRSLEAYLDDFGYLASAEKNSVYYKTLERNFDEYEFLKKLRNYLGYKIFLYDLISADAKRVLEQTNKTLHVLEKTE